MSVVVRPATAARFNDVATMLGPKNPDSSVCWCLSHRLDWKTNRALAGPARGEYVLTAVRRNSRRVLGLRRSRRRPGAALPPLSAVVPFPARSPMPTAWPPARAVMRVTATAPGHLAPPRVDGAVSSGGPPRPGASRPTPGDQGKRPTSEAHVGTRSSSMTRVTRGRCTTSVTGFPSCPMRLGRGERATRTRGAGMPARLVAPRTWDQVSHHLGCLLWSAMPGRGASSPR